MKMKLDADELSTVLEAAYGYRDEGVLKLRDDGVLMQMEDASGYATYSALIPDGAMSDYDSGELDRVGIRIKKLKDIVGSASDDVVLELTGGDTTVYQLSVKTGNRQYSVGVMDPDDVQGVIDVIPELDFAVYIKNDPSWLLDFVNDLEYVWSDKKNAHFFISPREGLLYLWSKQDDNEVLEWFHWEDFDEYDLRFEDGYKEDLPPDHHIPDEDKAMDALFASSYVLPIPTSFETMEFYFNNHYPMKVVGEMESGIKNSWIIPPRIPNEDSRGVLPERVIKERGVS